MHQCNPSYIYFQPPVSTNPFETEEENPKAEAEKPKPSPFHGLIGSCFESYLYIYIESLDR